MFTSVKRVIKKAIPKMNYLIVAVSFAILGGVVTDVGITQDRNPDRQKKVKEPVSITEPAPQPVPASDLPGGARTGFYCLPTGGRSGGVHDLGFIFEGQRVIIRIDRDRSGFDPIAIVRGSDFDSGGGGFFRYDDDSGGDMDPLIDFVAPFNGTYVLHVREFGGDDFGCYRYRVEIFN
jgi:hypothetical protein